MTTSVLTRETPIVSEDGRSGLRILVVEDNHAAASITGHMIEGMGHDVLIAHTGRQALVTAEAYAPHAALIDIELPDMDGYELARLLRTLPSLAATCLIAQTGSERDEYRHRANDEGFSRFLLKPVAFDLLRRVLDAVPR